MLVVVAGGLAAGQPASPRAAGSVSAHAAARSPAEAPLKVIVILEESPPSHALAGRLRAYFATAPARLGFPVTLDLSFDSDPRKRTMLEVWRVMVAQERKQNPAIPIQFPKTQRSAAFFGPLLVVGREEIARALTDDTLRRAHQLQLQLQLRARLPTQPRQVAAPSPRSKDPALAMRVRAAIDEATPRPSAWMGEVTLALALLSAAAMVGLLWWAASWPGSTGAAGTAGRGEAAPGSERAEEKR